MLYKTLRRLIQKGRTDGMKEKLAVFLATDQLTIDEYQELMELLGGGANG